MGLFVESCFQVSLLLNFLSFQELRSSCSAMLRKRHRVPSEGVKTLVQLSAINCQISLK
jgi:hypothetical protein